MEKAILLVSFGVAGDEARKNGIDCIAAEIAAAHGDYAVRQAFTSKFIRKQLAKRGIVKPSLDEALNALAEEGFTYVYVQPTHLTPGEEYKKKVRSAVDAAREKFTVLKLGETVFAQDRDYEEMAKFFSDTYGKGSSDATVLLGHGSPHWHNPVYEKLQAVFDACGKKIFVGVVEESDTPNFEMVAQRLNKAGAKHVTLAPLLLSGGIHVKEDMAGEGKESWKSRLEARGIKVSPILKGLGEYEAYRKIYLRKVLAVLQSTSSLHA